MRRAIAKSTTTTRSNSPPPQPPMPTNPSKPSRRSKSHSLFLPVVGSAVLLVLIYSVIKFFNSDRGTDTLRYSVIIDAGSTGSRVHVIGYRRVGGGGRGAGVVPVEVDFGISRSKKVVPGLSAYASDPDNAGRSLIELVDFAEGTVGRELWGQTEVRLMATAGLRLLDPGVAERIVDSCRKVLRMSGFVFRDDWATVISGMLSALRS